MKSGKIFSFIIALIVLLGCTELAQAMYNPQTGSFLNRDPIEERGGENLYGFVRNDAVNDWDHLGMLAYSKLGQGMVLNTEKRAAFIGLAGHLTNRERNAIKFMNNKGNITWSAKVKMWIWNCDDTSAPAQYKESSYTYSVDFSLTNGGQIYTHGNYENGQLTANKLVPDNGLYFVFEPVVMEGNGGWLSDTVMSGFNCTVGVISVDFSTSVFAGSKKVKRGGAFPPVNDPQYYEGSHVREAHGSSAAGSPHSRIGHEVGYKWNNFRIEWNCCHDANGSDMRGEGPGLLGSEGLRYQGMDGWPSTIRPDDEVSYITSRGCE